MTAFRRNDEKFGLCTRFLSSFRSFNWDLESTILKDFILLLIEMSMESSLRKYFNEICRILQNHGLLNIGDDEAKQKLEQAFHVCTPLLHDLSVNNEVSVSVKKILSLLSLDEATTEKFSDIFDLILNEIICLKNRIELQVTDNKSIKDTIDQYSGKLVEQSSQIQSLRDQISLCQFNTNTNQLKIDAYEFVRLFQFYYPT